MRRSTGMEHSDLMEFADRNGNRYPEIFTLIQSYNNSDSFNGQVLTFHEALRVRGIEPVHVSAYIKYRRFDGEDYNTPCIEKIRRHLSLSRPVELPRLQNDNDMLIIWNLGDITMLTIDHIEELKLLRPDINLAKLHNLRESICQGVNSLDDSINIIRQVDNIKDALSGEIDEMRCAPTYDALRKLYNSVRSEDNKGKIPNISHELLEKLGILEQEKELCQIIKKHQKVYHQRWKYVRKCMELVNRRSARSKTKKYANVVMCEEGLASGAAQLILAGLSSEVNFENLFSVYTTPGEMPKPPRWGREYAKMFNRTAPMIRRIQNEFGGKNCAMVYVAARLTFVSSLVLRWRIIENHSIKTLYDCLRETL